MRGLKIEDTGVIQLVTRSVAFRNEKRRGREKASQIEGWAGPLSAQEAERTEAVSAEHLPRETNPFRFVGVSPEATVAELCIIFFGHAEATVKQSPGLWLIIPYRRVFIRTKQS